MSRDVQQLCIVLYVLCFETLVINSRTSYLWRLNDDHTKIVDVDLLESELIGPVDSSGLYPNDPLFQILVATEQIGDTWIKKAPDSQSCSDCSKLQVQALGANCTSRNQDTNNGNNVLIGDETLDCGKPVNFTYYDSLGGVVNRKKHPVIPDSQLVFLFNRKLFKNGPKDVDIEALEKKLRRAKKEKPKSVQLFNQIGQFWYFKGDAEKAIECFRRALAVSPHNSEALLNLARILFSLQYLDDAIYLTRRSLEMQNSDRIAWQQYFMLGQIFKAYGHYQEAAVHLKHTLELKPGFEPALLALMEIEYLPPTSIHLYTMVIIVLLASVVVLIMTATGDKERDSDLRRKALSVRSLRLGLAQRRKKAM